MVEETLTVRAAVKEWLDLGLSNRSESTRTTNRHLVEQQHVLPQLGSRKVRDLTAQEVDQWLQGLAGSLSTRTLQAVRSALSRSISRAVARGRVRRNVVLLTEVPHGRQGRPSRSLTLQQALGVLTRTEPDPLYAYIVVSLLTGARTEELRALRWENVRMDAPPEYLEVWRSVRATGDTKTRKSRPLSRCRRCASRRYGSSAHAS